MEKNRTSTRLNPSAGSLHSTFLQSEALRTDQREPPNCVLSPCVFSNSDLTFSLWEATILAYSSESLLDYHDQQLEMEFLRLGTGGSVRWSVAIVGIPVGPSGIISFKLYMYFNYICKLYICNYI